MHFRLGLLELARHVGGFLAQSGALALHVGQPIRQPPLLLLFRDRQLHGRVQRRVGGLGGLGSLAVAQRVALRASSSLQRAPARLGAGGLLGARLQLSRLGHCAHHCRHQHAKLRTQRRRIIASLPRAHVRHVRCQRYPARVQGLHALIPASHALRRALGRLWRRQRGVGMDLRANHLLPPPKRLDGLSAAQRVDELVEHRQLTLCNCLELKL